MNANLFSEYAGKLVAFDLEFKRIFVCSENYDELVEVMKEKYPKVKYIPYAFPILNNEIFSEF